LRRISARSGRRVVVITDNAKYHHATLHAGWRRLQEPDFTLHFLPPYSPELNPIERVWKLLRRLWLHNRFFASLHELTEIVDAQFEVWKRPNPVLKRLCSL
jgi:transposase